MGATIYDRIGAKPAINARGIYTDLGGWRVSPRVAAAMDEANRSYVDMADLLRASGEHIARLIGAEAARVTPGATAGIVLATAACMTGTDHDKLDQLPDATGLRCEVLIQRAHRYRWDKFVTLAGARLVEVGDDTGTTGAQFSGAIGSDTLAVLHTGHLDGQRGSLPLREVASIMHGHGLPVIVDAAFLNYPLDRFGAILAAGADLAIFSAKYFGGPNTGGIVCGRHDLIEAVAANDFSKAGTRAQHALGRPFKLDRQLVVGVVAALEEWLELDHEARFEDYERKVQAIARRLRDLPGVELTPMCFTMEEELEPSPINCLVVRVDPTSGTSAADVDVRLQAANPSVLVHHIDDRLIVDVECVSDEELAVLGEQLRRALGQAMPT